jgi:deoxyribose-phosphate aldolase
LKTADQAGLDEKDNVKVVTGFIQEAIDEHFKLIMIARYGFFSQSNGF